MLWRLKICVRQDLQYSLPPVTSTNHLNVQEMTLHLSSRRSLPYANVFLPPHRWEHAPNDHSNPMWLYQLPNTTGIVCRDLNVHHVSWNDFPRAEPKGRQSTLGWSTTRWCSTTVRQRERQGPDVVLMRVLPNTRS